MLSETLFQRFYQLFLSLEHQLPHSVRCLFDPVSVIWRRAPSAAAEQLNPMAGLYFAELITPYGTAALKVVGE